MISFAFNTVYYKMLMDVKTYFSNNLAQFKDCKLYIDVLHTYYGKTVIAKDFFTTDRIEPR